MSGAPDPKHVQYQHGIAHERQRVIALLDAAEADGWPWPLPGASRMRFCVALAQGWPTLAGPPPPTAETLEQALEQALVRATR